MKPETSAPHNGQQNPQQDYPGFIIHAPSTTTGTRILIDFLIGKLVLRTCFLPTWQNDNFKEKKQRDEVVAISPKSTTAGNSKLWARCIKIPPKSQNISKPNFNQNSHLTFNCHPPPPDHPAWCAEFWIQQMLSIR